MKKILLTPVLLLISSFLLCAKPVPKSTCESVAMIFYTRTTGHTINTIDVAYTAFDKNNVPLYYVFNINVSQNQDKGFVIIAADDAVYPIIGYGNENKTYPIPSKQGGGGNVAFWMKARSNDIAQVRELNITPDPAITANWQSYMQVSAVEKIHQSQRISNSQFPSSSNFLVQSQWDQYVSYRNPNPYNYFCPYNSLTGCVATAMAQIMRYWNWPSYGVGASCDSISNYYSATICDNYAHKYDWANMTLVSPPAGDTAIARLMYDAGISVGMEYSPQGSDAQVLDTDAVDSVIWKRMDTACAQNALIKYFRYNKAMIKGLYAADYSDTNWIHLLKGELDSNRPINYAGYSSDTLDGHSWVCDGYDASNNFHMNWGWSGGGDGWYALTNISPRYSGVTYSILMEVLIGIYPDTTISPTSTPTLPNTVSVIKIYPNPSNGVFTFQINNENSIMKNIEVYNMLGEKVYSQLTTNNLPLSINLSNQPNGVYLYRIIDSQDNLLKMGKLIIER